MSAVNIALGIVLVAMLGGLATAWWHGHRHLFSILFLASIVILAAAMTIGRAPFDPKAVTAEKAPLHAPAATGSTAPPPAPDTQAGAP